MFGVQRRAKIAKNEVDDSRKEGDDEVIRFVAPYAAGKRDMIIIVFGAYRKRTATGAR